MSDGFFPGIDTAVEDTYHKLLPELYESGFFGAQSWEQVLEEQPPVLPRLRCCMPEAARVQQCKWRHAPVTASIRGTLPGLTEQQVRDTYKKALDIWNAACNVGLVWTDNFNAANIYAECVKIDGASGTLALSYLVPCGSGSTLTTRLSQQYDFSEKWTLLWLLEVMLHELGHALGLNHINNSNALMNPFSAGGRILFPTKYELDIMVPLYGKSIVIVPPVPPPTGQPTPQVGGVLVIDGFPYEISLKSK